MACIALGFLMSSGRRAGTICQAMPNLSLSQPHWISVPPAVSWVDGDWEEEILKYLLD
jgi:hypothetical protein